MRLINSTIIIRSVLYIVLSLLGYYVGKDSGQFIYLSVGKFIGCNKAISRISESRCIINRENDLHIEVIENNRIIDYIFIDKLD